MGHIVAITNAPPPKNSRYEQDKEGTDTGLETRLGRTRLKVQAPRLDLHIGTARIVHSVLIS
jgi:hypothetical protein